MRARRATAPRRAGAPLRTPPILQPTLPGSFRALSTTEGFVHSHVPRGTLMATLAPTPNTPRVTAPNFSESYARWMPMGPKLKFPPTTHPKLVSWVGPVVTFQYLRSEERRVGKECR